MEDSPEKSYDPYDRTLVFVDGKDDLDPVSSEDEAGLLKAQMSCGHAVTPDSLTKWCRHQLDQCPRCKSNVERKNLTSLCVQCTICTADLQKPYQFCWQCQRPWKGRAPRSDRCDNEGCSNKSLELLQTCKTIDLPQVTGAPNIPSVRACPKCGAIVEHSTKFCKNVKCPRCHVEFCFVCLKLKKNCSSPYTLCKDGVAPRQTSIPTRNSDRKKLDMDNLMSAQMRVLAQYRRQHQLRLLRDDFD